MVKAFNGVPRQPTFALAALLGIQRRFRIRGSIGRGIASATGFPEGCGLSCVAITLGDIAFHRYVQRRVASATVTSYVENLAAEISSVDTLLAADAAIGEFASVWDLSLDKTQVWATCPADRSDPYTFQPKPSEPCTTDLTPQALISWLYTPDPKPRVQGLGFNPKPYTLSASP